MLIIRARWPLPFDLYVLRFPAGSAIAPHTDAVEGGRHFRLNLVVREAQDGGEFWCSAALFESRRIKFFRPDIVEHSVSTVKRGSRYVLSIGWVRI